MITVFLYDIQKSKDTIFMLFIKIIMNIIKKTLIYMQKYDFYFIFVIFTATSCLCFINIII